MRVRSLSQYVFVGGFVSVGKWMDDVWVEWIKLVLD